jgi:hypothetical protein
MRSPKQTRPVHVDELRMDLRVEEIIEQPRQSRRRCSLIRESGFRASPMMPGSG